MTPALRRIAPPTRRLAPQLLGLLAALLLTACWACAQPASPPTAGPIVQRVLGDPPRASLAGAGAQHSIGNPTALEQFYLELVNRARANPSQEALRLRNLSDPNILNAYQYFGVNLDQFTQDMSSLPPAPPLAFHPALIAAARAHSQDMLNHNFQGHYGSSGSSPGQRITAQTYNWSTYGENVFAYAESVEHGHAGFEVDWGSGPSGMQNPPGHRLNIHSRSFREIGIGVVEGRAGSVGPQLVTQDFATRFGATPLITGVAYYDLNGNAFYDPGEGLGGVRVDVSGSGSYALTAPSGGYAVPVPGNGTYTVTFSATGLVHAATIHIANAENAKVDYMPSFAPPRLTGPVALGAGQEADYTFTSVGGATAYQLKVNRLTNYFAVAGAEPGQTNTSAEVTPGYNVIETSVKAAGTASYHLAHPQPEDQTLSLNALLRPGTTGQLTFGSRLGWASPTQVARVQASTDEGAHWENLWSRPGTSNSGQGSFSTVSLSLASFAGSELRLRFVYDFTGGTYYVGAGNGLGWYIDNITVSGAQVVVHTSVTPAADPVRFVAAHPASHLLSVRAQVGSQWMPWGPALEVTVSGETSPVLELHGLPVMTADRVEFGVRALGGPAGAMHVEMASTPRGPWTVDPTATFQAAGSGAAWKVSAAKSSAPMSFYRVRSL